MKSSLPSCLLIKAVSLSVLVFSAALGAKAGPGIDYWRRMDLMQTAKQIQPINVPHEMTGSCAGAQNVRIVEAHKDWAGSKGPSQLVQIGTKTICHSFGSSSTVLQKSWPNAKGMMQSVTVKTEHECSHCSTAPHV